MKLVTCAIVCLALGTLGGFTLGYVLLAKPAVTALEAKRTEASELQTQLDAEKTKLRDREQELAAYKNAVQNRDAVLRTQLDLFASKVGEAEFLNPEGVGAAFSWFAMELDRPIAPAPLAK